MEYEAIRLFVDRAIRVNSAFRLHRRNASAVVEICRQLDGIPLAIEMAAARLRSLSVGEIQDRLADRFRLLTSGNRGVLPRQQTLRAAIDWSYDQLAAAERDLFCRLAVFAGGWTCESAASVHGRGRRLRHSRPACLLWWISRWSCAGKRKKKAYVMGCWRRSGSMLWSAWRHVEERAEIQTQASRLLSDAGRNGWSETGRPGSSALACGSRCGT